MNDTGPTTLQEAVLHFADEKVCLDYMRQIKWADGKPICPKCASDNIGVIETRSMFKCRACKKQFIAAFSVSSSSLSPASLFAGQSTRGRGRADPIFGSARGKRIAAHSTGETIMPNPITLEHVRQAAEWAKNANEPCALGDTRRAAARTGVNSCISPPPPCDSPIDDWIEEQIKQTDVEAVAKRITDPVIESMRKELDKIDVTPFKK